MEPSHFAHSLWRRLQRYPPVERGAFLPRPEENRPAQRRVDQSRRRRGIHRRRRLPGAVQGADRRQTRGGQRPDQGIGPARAGRRRLLGRPEMGIPAQGRRRAQVPHLQRRRGRSRRLHEPQRDRERSARPDRGHGDRRLHHRGHGRRHLHPRRISARRPSAEGRHRPGQRIRPPGQGHPGTRIRLRHRRGRRRGRIRLRRGDGADRLARRARRPASSAPAVPGAKGRLGLSHQYQ